MMALTEKETITYRHSGPRAGIYRKVGPGLSNGLVFGRFRVKPGMTVKGESGMTVKGGPGMTYTRDRINERKNSNHR